MQIKCRPQMHSQCMQIDMPMYIFSENHIFKMHPPSLKPSSRDRFSVIHTGRMFAFNFLH